MKKFYVMMAAALVAFSLASCNKKAQNEPEQPKQDSTVVVDAIPVEISAGLIFTDAVAEEGWWQIMGQNEEFYISLSNKNTITTAAGTYTAADLDQKYSYLMTKTDTISFVDGSFTLDVKSAEEVIISGNMVGDNEKTYALNLHYTAPKKEKTATITISAGQIDETYKDYDLYAFGGYADDYSGMASIAFFVENTIAGTYTEDNLYPNGTYIYTAAGSQMVYKANFTVVATDEQYTLAGKFLCYDNTEYDLTIIVAIEQVTPPTGEEVTLNGLFGTYIDDYRDLDGSYVLYLNDTANVEIALALYDTDFLGSFTMDDLDSDWSYYSNGEDILGIQDLAVTAAANADSTTHYTGYLIANNGIKYIFDASVDVEALLEEGGDEESFAPKKAVIRKDFKVVNNFKFRK